MLEQLKILTLYTFIVTFSFSILNVLTTKSHTIDLAISLTTSDS